MSRFLPALVLAVAVSCAGCNAVDRDGYTDSNGDFIAETNQAIVDEMKRDGEDMDKSYPVDFYLYFGDQAAAESAAKSLEAKAYATDVGPNEDGEWEVMASKNTKITAANLDAMEREMERVAKAEKGEYDGLEIDLEGEES